MSFSSLPFPVCYRYTVASAIRQGRLRLARLGAAAVSFSTRLAIRRADPPVPFLKIKGEKRFRGRPVSAISDEMECVAARLDATCKSRHRSCLGELNDQLPTNNTWYNWSEFHPKAQGWKLGGSLESRYTFRLPADGTTLRGDSSRALLFFSFSCAPIRFARSTLRN